VRNLVLHTTGKTQLWVLVKRVLSNMFRSKREEVAGDCRKLYSEEFPDIKSSPNIRVIKSRIRKAKHVARMGDNSYVYRALAGKSEGKRPRRRPGRR